ncbi:hypothetical protein LEP1GSC079_2306 [Leptospira interrogans str. FPW1039]|uniref:Uncharacterized protein n=3 Tax=Leptospira interrogans TaxID=173 RepID=A0A0E2DLB1_LEPIR|nr:hypothetical protein LEP1GSC045_1533 [Leptospira interrogans serovar Pomona str. Kennewicki LC82-25]EJP14719.1 hypothetical protein LEP1GSC080_2036 [Leptospira interrogans str. FPW2026]EKN95710.1 hypothetical protein LEP1GSC014_1883 [Leptospira interrogans serovar Pomona str. Pomona]EKO67992.1 hypothetical protein LEP1GSC069_1421 [Leptospira interrogans serovar Canicola str. Fiocruz LV133]EKR17017.1 hypothetical protein LEP1GSC019_3656 [Leptospira interrogans serovar Pyrogenes str. 200600696
MIGEFNQDSICLFWSLDDFYLDFDLNFSNAEKVKGDSLEKKSFQS